jgi:hypothetical protein
MFLPEGLIGPDGLIAVGRFRRRPANAQIFAGRHFM